MKNQMILSQVLMIATFANARSLRFPAAADVPTDAYELVCSQGMIATLCHEEFGTHCNPTGAMENESSFINADCSEAFCFCRLLSTAVPCRTDPEDPTGHLICGSAATSNAPAPPGALTTLSPSQISAGAAQLSSMGASLATFLATDLPAFYSDGMEPTRVQATASLQASFSVASAASSSNVYDGPASAGAIKTVFITVTEQPPHHHNGTSSQQFTEAASHHHHNGTSTHSHHSPASGFASGSGRHNETGTFSHHSTSSSTPSFSTLSELPLTPSNGFAADRPSPTSSTSKVSLASTTKTMSALTTSEGSYD